MYGQGDLMNKQKEVIGTKEVYVSQPYRPNELQVGELIGREKELMMLTSAWMGGRDIMPLSPLLLGEPGVGKNRLVYEIAMRTGKDLYIFQGHEDVTSEDLACYVRFSDEPGKKMDYVLSPLVTAMLKGGIIFVDEISKIRPRALALLVSVLDERRYIDSTLLGERITAHDGFRFIAAANTADLEGNAMPEFIKSRMRPVINVEYPCQEEVENIIKDRFPDLGEKLGDHLLHFWELWNTLGRNHPPTPRDVIYVFNLANNLAGFDAANTIRPFASLSSSSFFPLEVKERSLPIERHHLESAFREIFPR